MTHEHSGEAPKNCGGLKKPHSQVSAVEADWPSPSSPPQMSVAKLVVAVAGGAVEGAAVMCWGSVAGESENQALWGVSDGVEALSCALGMASLFGWVGSEGRS